MLAPFIATGHETTRDCWLANRWASGEGGPGRDQRPPTCTGELIPALGLDMGTEPRTPRHGTPPESDFAPEGKRPDRACMILAIRLLAFFGFLPAHKPGPSTPEPKLARTWRDLKGDHLGPQPTDIRHRGGGKWGPPPAGHTNRHQQPAGSAATTALFSALRSPTQSSGSKMGGRPPRTPARDVAGQKPERHRPPIAHLKSWKNRTTNVIEFPRSNLAGGAYPGARIGPRISSLGADWPKLDRCFRGGPHTDPAAKNPKQEKNGRCLRGSSEPEPAASSRESFVYSVSCLLSGVSIGVRRRSTHFPRKQDFGLVRDVNGAY